MSDLAIVIILSLFVVLFVGEPDLHDKILGLMDKEPCVMQEQDNE